MGKRKIDIIWDMIEYFQTANLVVEVNGLKIPIIRDNMDDLNNLPITFNCSLEDNNVVISNFHINFFGDYVFATEGSDIIGDVESVGKVLSIFSDKNMDLSSNKISLDDKQKHLFKTNIFDLLTLKNKQVNINKVKF